MPPPSPSDSSSSAQAPRGVRAVVGLVGKHPGWADFVDVATGSPLLDQVARRVGTDGLVRAFHAGALEGIPKERRLASIEHDMLVLTPAGPVVGRWWLSRDGRGRVGPLGVLVGVEGMTTDAGWLADFVAPRLPACQRMATETSSAELVRLALGETARQAEDALALQVGEPRPATGAATLLARLGEHTPDVARLMGLIEAALVKAGGPSDAARLSLAARVPALPVGDAPLAGPRAWAALVRDVLSERGVSAGAMPTIAAMAPAGVATPPWIDVLIGPVPPGAWASVLADQAIAPVLGADGQPPTPDALMAAEWAGERWRTIAARETDRAQSAPERQRASGRSLAVLAIGGVVLVGVVAGLLVSRWRGAHAGGADAGGVGGPEALVGGTTQVEGTPRGVSTAAIDELEARLGQVRDILGPAEELDAQLSAREQELRQRVAALREPGSTTATLAELAAQTEALMTDSQAAGLAWATRQRATPPSPAPLLREAWERALAPGSELARGDMLARRRAASMRAAFTKAEGALAALESAGDPEAAGGGPDARALVLAWRDRRANAQTAIVSAALEGDGARSVEQGERALAWRRDAGGLSNDVSAVREALALGATLDEAWAQDRPTLAELERRIGESPVRTDVPGAGAEALRSIAALRELARAKDEQALSMALRAAAADTLSPRAGEALQAWQTLTAPPDKAPDQQADNQAQSLWTDDAQRVARLLDLHEQAIVPALARLVAPAARREQLDARTRQQLRSVWDRAWARATQAQDTQAAEQLEQLASRVGATVAPARALSPDDVVGRARALRALREGVAAATTDAQIRDAAKVFVDAIGPGAGADDAIVALARQAAHATDAQPLLAQLGPGATGWTLAGDAEDGAELTYERDGQRLSFRRVQADAPRVTYVGTTELSVGAALALLEAAPEAARRGVLDGLWAFAPGVSDPREGPRSWDWADAQRSGIRLAEQWLRPRVGGEQGAYAPGMVPGRPSMQSPMNYLSPAAAQGLAALAGCRLPTLAEWRGMLGGGVAAAEGANLRDATFDRQAQHAQANPQTGAAPGAGAVGGAVGGAGMSASVGDDGVLWLAPVNDGPRTGAFAHVVGNVAELVVGEAGQVQVAGWSALSVWPESADRAWELNAARASRGFADVGLRLAFDVPAEARVRSVAQELRRALQAAPGQEGPADRARSERGR